MINRREAFQNLLAGTAGVLSMGGVALATSTIETSPETAATAPLEEQTIKSNYVVDVEKMVKLAAPNISAVVNPDFYLQKIAVAASSYAIVFIENPCDELIYMALKNMPSLIHPIAHNNPNLDVKFLFYAYEQNATSLKNVTTPNHIWNVIKKDPEMICSFFHTTEEMRIYAIENSTDPKLARCLGTLTNNELVAAVKRDGTYIIDIMNEWDDDIERLAIAQNPEILDYLATNCIDITEEAYEHQLKMMKKVDDNDVYCFFHSIVDPSWETRKLAYARCPKLVELAKLFERQSYQRYLKETS